MQKQFFGKSTFSNLRGDDFQMDYLRHFFFKTVFFVLKSLRMSHLTIRGHFLSLQNSFLPILFKVKSGHKKSSEAKVGSNFSLGEI